MKRQSILVEWSVAKTMPQVIPATNCQILQKYQTDRLNWTGPKWSGHFKTCNSVSNYFHTSISQSSSRPDFLIPPRQHASIIKKGTAFRRNLSTWLDSTRHGVSRSVSWLTGTGPTSQLGLFAHLIWIWNFNYPSYFWNATWNRKKTPACHLNYKLSSSKKNWTTCSSHLTSRPSISLGLRTEY